LDNHTARDGRLDDHGAAVRARPTALGWVDPETSTAPEWDTAQIRRLARQLGCALVWPPESSPIPLADVVREVDADAVIVATPDRLDALTLHAVMRVADVETVTPRMSFARWACLPGRLG
jgi:hypothetical protein